jgi:hypothetical protein
MVYFVKIGQLRYSELIYRTLEIFECGFSLYEKRFQSNNVRRLCICNVHMHAYLLQTYSIHPVKLE